MEPVKPIRKRIVRQTKRVLKWFLFLVLAYVAILLIGLIPVNRNFVPPKEGIEIFLVSNAVHADIIVPKSNNIVAWNETFSDATFNGDVATNSHVAFGWGERGFFLETQTWGDFKIATAANALLLPSSACMHVSFTQPEYYSNKTSVTISKPQYKKLVDFINGSFKLNKRGQVVQIEGYAYSTTDAFFDAVGRYHLLNTCNSWVGRALKTAGVKVPWFSPMPKTPTLYIESGK